MKRQPPCAMRLAGDRGSKPTNASVAAARDQGVVESLVGIGPGGQIACLQGPLHPARKIFEYMHDVGNGAAPFKCQPFGSRSFQADQDVIDLQQVGRRQAFYEDSPPGKNLDESFLLQTSHRFMNRSPAHAKTCSDLDFCRLEADWDLVGKDGFAQEPIRGVSSSFIRIFPALGGRVQIENARGSAHDNYPFLSALYPIRLRFVSEQLTKETACFYMHAILHAS